MIYLRCIDSRKRNQFENEDGTQAIMSVKSMDHFAKTEAAGLLARQTEYLDALDAAEKLHGRGTIEAEDLIPIVSLAEADVAKDIVYDGDVQTDDDLSGGGNSGSEDPADDYVRLTNTDHQTAQKPRLESALGKTAAKKTTELPTIAGTAADAKGLVVGFAEPPMSPLTDSRPISPVPPCEATPKPAAKVALATSATALEGAMEKSSAVAAATPVQSPPEQTGMPAVGGLDNFPTQQIFPAAVVPPHPPVNLPEEQKPPEQ